MEIIHLENDLETTMNNELCLVDFYAEWCGPCKMLAPNLEEIKDKVKIIKVDIDKFTDTAVKYGVMSVPTLIVFKNNKEVDKMIGYRDTDEMLESIEKAEKM